MKYILVISLLFAFELEAVWPQQKLLEPLSIEEGLSQGMIYDLLQTKDGYLWFATKDGLNRYDGYRFKVFFNDPYDPWSLSSNDVTALYEDRKGRLWVGTQSNGLDLYDPATKRFYHFSYKAGQKNGLSGNSITHIFEDPGGTIWVANNNRYLDRFKLPDVLPDHPDLNQTAQWTGAPIHVPAIWSSTNKIKVLSDGRILMELGEEIREIDWKNGATHLLRLPPTPEGDNRAYAFMEDKKGVLWVTRGGGYVLKQKGKESVHFAFPEKIKPLPFIEEGTHGEIWICSHHVIWQAASPASLSEAPVFKLVDKTERANIVIFTKTLVDRAGILWLGTNGYGARKLNSQKSGFVNYLKGESIWSVYADRKEKIWVKLVDGYYPIDRTTGMVSTPVFLEQMPFHKHSMLQDRQNRYWFLVKTWERPFRYRLKGFSPDFREITDLPVEGEYVSNVRMIEDEKGRILIGANKGLLHRYDPASRALTTFNFASLLPSFANEIETVALVQDQRKDIWVGTRHGLVRGIPEGDSLRFFIFQNNPTNRTSLANNVVLSIFPDPANADRVWVGTKGGGVGKMDLKTETFHFYTPKDGLVNNVVYGILPDKNGSLWLSTNQGIAKMSGPGVQGDGAVIFRSYGVQDGLPGLEFNTSAFVRTASGALIFGGVAGLTVFNPEHLTGNPIAPKIAITDLEINNREMTESEIQQLMPASEDGLKTLVLRHDQNILGIRFSALDYTAPALNRYRYQLVGVDPDWVEAGIKNVAYYSQLRPGSYLFRVEGSNSDGVWGKNPAEIRIVVHPPWWRSWWMYTIYFLILAGLVRWYYLGNINRIRLENEVQFKEKEALRLAEIDEVKTRFFSNITHEFRTPLTLILEPARRILAKARDPEITSNARHIEANSLRLLNMVNQLLDLSKLESGSMGLDLRRADFAETARDIFRSFLPLAETRGIELTFSIHKTIPESLIFDPHKFGLILNNLLSNALKFTPKGGKVVVSVDGGRWTADGATPSTVHHQPSTIVLKVTDTGIGIPPEALDKIFNRFYQVDSSHTREGEGTGIGLALSKELATLMGGDLTVESTPGKGSIFTLQLTIPSAPSQPAQRTGAGSPKAEELDVFSVAEASKPVNTSNNTPPLFSPAFGEARGEPSRSERAIALIIEDNPELRTFIKQSIIENWQVIEATNGEEGVRSAIELIPDLVISDLMMPVKDGYAVCDELKNNELTAHIPIILLTAKASLDAKLKGLRKGADDYLTKPFHTEELLARMENLIEVRRKLREHFSKMSLGSAISDTSDGNDFLSAPDKEFLRRFIAMLEENLGNTKIGIDDFAQKMFLSRSQLHRKIKALTDQNPTDFIKDYRLEKAISMLKNKEGLVAEVASKVGFANEKYFATVFKEKFGVSPSRV